MKTLDLEKASFEELDAYKTGIHKQEQALREQKLAVEAAMQAKLEEHHEAQYVASPVHGLVNTGDGLMGRRDALERELSALIEGEAAEANSGANVTEGA